MSRQVAATILEWGKWEPLESLDPDTLAVLDVTLNDDGGLAAIEVACGPLLKDATEEELASFALTDGIPRVQNFLEWGDRDSPWTQRSTGHWQLHVMKRYLPNW